MKAHLGFLPGCFIVGFDWDNDAKRLFLFLIPMIPIVLSFGSEEMNVYQINDWSNDWYYVAAHDEESAIKCFEEQTGELFDGECSIHPMGDVDGLVDEETRKNLTEPTILNSSVDNS